MSGPWLCSELCLEGAAKVMLLPALLHVPAKLSPSWEAAPVPLLTLGTELAPHPWFLLLMSPITPSKPYSKP